MALANISRKAKFLRAGHVFQDFFDAGYLESQVSVTVRTGANILTPAAIYPILDFNVHPDYRTAQTNDTPDISEILVDASLLEPLGIYHNLTIGKGSTGEIAEAAGYGYLRYPSTGFIPTYSGDAAAWKAQVLSSPIISSNAWLDATYWDATPIRETLI